VLKLTDREPPIFSIAPPAYVAEFSENVLFVTVADAFGLFQIVPPVLATFSIHTARAASRRPSVVVMQAIEDGECYDPTVSLGQSRQRLFLPEALVWPRLVVEAGVLRDEAEKMALAKHEDMVEQFAPESADKAEAP